MVDYPLPDVVAKRSPVHKGYVNLRAQRSPRPVQALVVSCPENSIVKSDVERGHPRGRQRPGQVADLLQHHRDTREVTFGGVAAQPVDSQPFQRRPQAGGLTDIVGAELGNRRPAMVLGVHEPLFR